MWDQDAWIRGTIFGLNGINVGREASFGMGKGAGQCNSENNPKFGNCMIFLMKEERVDGERGKWGGGGSNGVERNRV